MRLLLKWLRPEVVPSPRRKKIPFGTQVQLYLYRRCIKRLAKWYPRYAFSDSITLGGSPTARITHEHRDLAFEAEIKRIRMQMPNDMVDCIGLTSHFPDKRKSQRYYDCFHFEDHLIFEIDGKKISIDHGQGRSFVSSLKGKLMESDGDSLFAKYSFSGSLRGNKARTSSLFSSPSESLGGKDNTSENNTSKLVFEARPEGPNFHGNKTGGLFGDDPLFGKKSDAPKTLVSTSSNSVKSVEGVTIDESF